MLIFFHSTQRGRQIQRVKTVAVLKLFEPAGSSVKMSRALEKNVDPVDVRFGR